MRKPLREIRVNARIAPKTRQVPNDQQRAKVSPIETPDASARICRCPVARFERLAGDPQFCNRALVRAVAPNEVNDATTDEVFGTGQSVRVLPGQPQCQLNLSGGCRRRGNQTGCRERDALAVVNRIVGQRRLEIGSVGEVERLGAELKLGRIRK